MATIADDRPWRAKWQIKRMLGQGGQGTAHLVSSIAEPDQEGVLKRLRWRTSPKARARMHREVTILDTLAHQGLKVPRVLDSNIDRYLDGDILLYFVMEFIPGQTLEEEVRARGPLELNKAGSLVHALAEIVSAAHRERVIHRDLKSNNIIVRDFDQNDVVIVDYGLSFNAAEETGTLTDPGEQLRSHFLSLPEANTPGGDRRDGRSDITAVCAILYFCLTGHFPGQLRDSKGRAIHRSEGYSVSGALSADPRCEQVELFLDRGLAYEVENRFQSWEEFFSRLEGALSADSRLVEDPLQVAAEVTQELRRADRVTRIQHYQTYCGELFADIQRYAESLRDNLGRSFEINVGGMNYPETKSFPEDMDHVTDLRVLTLTLRPHRVHWRVYYMVGGRGTQCVLLRFFKLYTHGAEATPLHETEWEELCWFNPDDRPPFAKFQPAIQNDLSQGLRALTKQLLP